MAGLTLGYTVFIYLILHAPHLLINFVSFQSSVRFDSQVDFT